MKEIAIVYITKGVDKLFSLFNKVYPHNCIKFDTLGKMQYIMCSCQSIYGNNLFYVLIK